MSVVCLVTYEIHPTTRGGCGVLLHHAAAHLIRAGHEIVLLLDVPADKFEQFCTIDRLALPNPDRCRAYRVDALSTGASRAGGLWLQRSIRFADALAAVAQQEKLDAVEFFDFTGAAYVALVRRLFYGATGGQNGPAIAVRLHNTLELIDDFAPTREFDRDRYRLHALERAALRLADTVLTPTRTYFEAYGARYHIDPARVMVSLPAKGTTPRVSRPDPRAPFSIIHVGRLMHFKGVDQFVLAAVELFRRRPNLNATIDLIGADTEESPGEASYAAYLRTLIPPPLLDRFLFPGHLSHEQIAAHLARALFAVYPNRFESFCYALHETRDAGVPVIVNDTPGMREFCNHEVNALLYDGRTDSLVAAMERLFDNDALRERLVAPVPVAPPLGDFYSHPPAPAVHRAALPRTLTVILEGIDPAAAAQTLAALAAQSHPAVSILRLSPSDPGPDTIWLLGRTWRPSSPAPRSADALVILRSGDVPAPHWLHRCATALSTGAAFASTWATRDSQPIAHCPDLEPELLPFKSGSTPTRCLIRTIADLPLADLFDTGLSQLGEVGLLWSTIAQHGPGVTLPEPLIELAADRPSPADPVLLKYLLCRYGAPFSDRLRLYSAFQHEALQAPAPDRLQAAAELGGRTLAELALKKLARRITGS
jgi:glycosyltransferase involved in cell wall biosynthesis